MPMTSIYFCALATIPLYISCSTLLKTPRFEPLFLWDKLKTTVAFNQSKNYNRFVNLNLFQVPQRFRNKFGRTNNNTPVSRKGKQRVGGIIQPHERIDFVELHFVRQRWNDMKQFFSRVTASKTATEE